LVSGRCVAAQQGRKISVHGRDQALTIGARCTSACRDRSSDIVTSATALPRNSWNTCSALFPANWFHLPDGVIAEGHLSDALRTVRHGSDIPCALGGPLTFG
jgi:hypothetical protein